MGAALREIKRKVQGVEKTKQITRAMNMVAASKLTQAQTRMENFRAYAGKITEILQNVSERVEGGSHPLLAVRESKRAVVIVMTSDRGLCGGFNSNIIRVADRLIKDIKAEGKEVALIAVGKKGRDVFRRKETISKAYVDALKSFDISLANEIADMVMASYQAEECDEVHLVFSEFVNMGSQKPLTMRVLPLERPEREEEDPSLMLDYLYEPPAEVILDRIIPTYVRSIIHRGLLETSAGEHGARMVAMDNATRACDDMIETLTLQFNKARQAAITGELMDIVGGTEALAASK